MPVHHVILTRFSVYYPDRGTPSDDWFRSRLDLFRRYPLPSVVAQDPQPDQWLIFVHESTPDWVVKELTSMMDPYPGYALSTMQHGYSEQEVQALVTAALPAGVRRLATSLLDSDDVLSFDYCAKAREAVEHESGIFVNFINGVQVGGGKVYRRSDPSNPFLTFVEDLAEGETAKTALLDWHTRVRDHAPVLQVRTTPVWCQVVHGGNIANALHGVRTDPRQAARLFPVELNLEPVSRPTLVLLSILTTVRLVARVLRKRHRIIWALQVLPVPWNRKKTPRNAR